MSQKFPPTVRNQSYLDSVKSYPYPDNKIDTSVALPNSKKPGYSPVFRNQLSVNGLITAPHPEALTIYDVLEKSIEYYGDHEFIGRREKLKNGQFGDYKFETYKQIGEKRDLFGSGLNSLLTTNYPEIDLTNLIISLYSGNTYEWFLTDFACHAFGFSNTTLYDSLGPDASKYILKVTESPIVVSSKPNISKILEISNESFVKLIIVMDEDFQEDDVLVEKAKVKGVDLIPFYRIMDLGKKQKFPHKPPTQNDLMTICFTSGTSGDPKGVEISHGVFVAGVAFCFCHVKAPKYPNCASLCFLPLAHVLERYKVGFEVAQGAKVLLLSDPTNPRNFLEDLKSSGMTSHIAAVPRVFSKMEQKLKDTFDKLPGLKGSFIRSIISFKQWYDFDYGANGKGPINAVIKKLILSKIREQIGFQNLELVIAGGAPMNESTIKYLRSCLGCNFQIAYGLSELSGACFLSTFSETNLSTCGTVGTTTEARLRDVPELDHTWETTRSGEILLRGPQVFKKYFKNSEKTKEAFDEDGWFCTGDIGKWTEDGKLQIVDRVKNFFKLSQGEYVTVERTENIYLAACDFIDQVFIYGNSYQDYLVAIVGVTPETIYDTLMKYPELLQKLDIKSVADVDDLLKSENSELRKCLVDLMNERINSEKLLLGFEKIKKAYFRVNPLSAENHCLTPTMKVKRINCTKLFKPELEKLYVE